MIFYYFIRANKWVKDIKQVSLAQRNVINVDFQIVLKIGLTLIIPVIAKLLLF